MPRIGEAIDAAEYRGYRPETGTARNQEHDQDLVFDGLDRGYSAEDLMAQMLGNGDGGLRLLMIGGDLSALLVDLSGLEFGNALLSALGMPKRTPVECMIADFSLQKGLLNTRTFFLVTTDRWSALS